MEGPSEIESKFVAQGKHQSWMTRQMFLNTLERAQNSMRQCLKPDWEYRNSAYARKQHANCGEKVTIFDPLNPENVIVNLDFCCRDTHYAITLAYLFACYPTYMYEVYKGTNPFQMACPICYHHKREIVSVDIINARSNFFTHQATEKQIHGGYYFCIHCGLLNMKPPEGGHFPEITGHKCTVRHYPLTDPENIYPGEKVNPEFPIPEIFKLFGSIKEFTADLAPQQLPIGVSMKLTGHEPFVTYGHTFNPTEEEEEEGKDDEGKDDEDEDAPPPLPPRDPKNDGDEPKRDPQGPSEGKEEEEPQKRQKYGHQGSGHQRSVHQGSGHQTNRQMIKPTGRACMNHYLGLFSKEEMEAMKSLYKIILPLYESNSKKDRVTVDVCGKKIQVIRNESFQRFDTRNYDLGHLDSDSVTEACTKLYVFFTLVSMTMDFILVDLHTKCPENVQLPSFAKLSQKIRNIYESDFHMLPKKSDPQHQKCQEYLKYMGTIYDRYSPRPTLLIEV